MTDWHQEVYKKNQDPIAENWIHLAGRIKNRDHYRCKRCGKTKPAKYLTVHHIIPRPEGSNEERNLITLCSPCHDYVELNQIRSWDEIVSSKIKQPKRSQVIKQDRETSETFERPAWHGWVYGGEQNPSMEKQ